MQSDELPPDRFFGAPAARWRRRKSQSFRIQRTDDRPILSWSFRSTGDSYTLRDYTFAARRVVMPLWRDFKLSNSEVVDPAARVSANIHAGDFKYLDIVAAQYKPAGGPV